MTDDGLAAAGGQRSQIGPRMIQGGIALALVGLVVLLLQASVTVSLIGIGVLVFGLQVGLAGLVVVGVRSSRGGR